MIDDIKQSIAELEARLKILRDQRDAHQKASGIAEEQARVRLELTELSEDIQAEKEALAELQGKKATAVSGVCSQIADAMSALLPEGKAVFQIEDEKVFIGWERGGVVVPAESLSGGQRAIFNPALAYVLAGQKDEVLLSIEGAEIDDSNLIKMLEHIAKKPRENVQFLISSCHVPSKIPDGWTVTEIN